MSSNADYAAAELAGTRCNANGADMTLMNHHDIIHFH